MSLAERPVMNELGIRWTVGDVSRSGYEALRLSIAGAMRAFGPHARYAVCVNTVPLAEARARLGQLPAAVELRAVGREEIPRFLLERFDAALAEGVGWKFAPLRVFADRFELSLDNDCILWHVPGAVERALEGDRPVIAADERACFGQFATLCSGSPRNSGIRGVPARLDLEAALRRTLAASGATMRSELDEQGLQVATLEREGCEVVGTDDVTICSPFPPHSRGLGGAGVHFVGLNAKALPWLQDGRPAHEITRQNFERLRGEIEARVGLAPVRGGFAEPTLAAARQSAPP
jgi:hypothetical protein